MKSKLTNHTTPTDSNNSAEFICKCKKTKSWITENKISNPCPNCGRHYIGKYSRKKLTIEAIEL